MSQRALFEGLIRDTDDHPVDTADVGGVAHYVVMDGGFRFHVDAEGVDRQVLSQLREQILDNRDAVTQGAMQMMGQDDLFTKAMIDSSLNNIDANFTQLIAQGLPENARAYLGMLGFKIVINYHGEVMHFDQPGLTGSDEE